MGGPERLRRMGVVLVRCPEAVGYHWHPALRLDQIPDLVRVERERAKMGLVFYRKHPTRRVRYIIQFTWLHVLLWELLTLGGVLNERSLRPLLAWLIRRGQQGLARELLRLPLNHQCPGDGREARTQDDTVVLIPFWVLTPHTCPFRVIVDCIRSIDQMLHGLAGGGEPETHNMAVVTLAEMMEAGAHFGHQTRRWNRDVALHLLQRNGVHIIDLVQTAVCMNNTYK